MSNEARQIYEALGVRPITLYLAVTELFEGEAEIVAERLRAALSK